MDASSSDYNLASILSCCWKNCDKKFDDAELLYIHICEHHVGRKSMGNLCLECQWDSCGVKTTKRDHMTSHLRVHVPLKPHACNVCGKPFKRSQDLRKHERIHTEAHQQTLRVNQKWKVCLAKNGCSLPDSSKNPTRLPTPPSYPGGSEPSSFIITKNTLTPEQAELSPLSFSPESLSPQSMLSDSYILFPSQSNYEETLFQFSDELYSMPQPSTEIGCKRRNHQIDQDTNGEIQDLIEEFVNGAVKSKKLKPEYNQDMADKLSKLETNFSLDSDFVSRIVRNDDELADINQWLCDLSKSIDMQTGNMDPLYNQDKTSLYPNLSTMSSNSIFDLTVEPMHDPTIPLDYNVLIPSQAWEDVEPTDFLHLEGGACGSIKGLPKTLPMFGGGQSSVKQMVPSKPAQIKSNEWSHNIQPMRRIMQANREGEEEVNREDVEDMKEQEEVRAGVRKELGERTNEVRYQSIRTANTDFKYSDNCSPRHSASAPMDERLKNRSTETPQQISGHLPVGVRVLITEKPEQVENQVFEQLVRNMKGLRIKDEQVMELEKKAEVPEDAQKNIAAEFEGTDQEEDDITPPISPTAEEDYRRRRAEMTVHRVYHAINIAYLRWKTSDMLYPKIR
ncbi:uncharacterized protein VTP21DRAFT_7084 [Calcarisporiella thermophila]|uniref:uncharacterized protein n=1 Tax=Calcarisporiella thermophila TaxID=911321 RepID=UPI003744B0BF